jgi:uncharacterized protein YndB with AHSA1/START domain
MPEKRRKEEPIRQSVHVDCPIDDAFRVFTDGFAEWWPLPLYSKTGDEAETCVIEPWVGGRVFERSRSGEEHEWGEVIRWDPPSGLSFTWDPGGIDDIAQTVDVEFEIAAYGTEVTLTHTGWEAPGVAVCAVRAECIEMWNALLTHFFFEFANMEILAVS